MAVTGAQLMGGRYQLRQVLGTGGMATVWRATDDVLGRDVAVKVLSPQFAADAGFVARFNREARNVAALSNPHIVTVFDCGLDDTTPYIVMELVSGRTLRQVLDEVGPLPPDEAVAIAAAVCEALDAAHAAGLVHRDIKPANIVLSGRDVKVLDFGIARAQFPAGGTRTNGVLGTAAYLSPEQASGERVGPQSDLYSLGCVLFEMLTGAPPFAADSEVGVAYRHVHDDPGLPSQRRSAIPPKLDWIVARLLAKKPADRPAGALAAREGLLAALAPDQTAVFASPPGSGVQVSRPSATFRWRPSETVLAMCLLAALAALAVVLVTEPARPAAPTLLPSQPAATYQAHQSSPAGQATSPPSAPRVRKLSPLASAAGAFVGELETAQADGQVSQQAGQNLFNQLQQLLFNRPQNNPTQVEQQYAQLLEQFDQFRSKGQISGSAAPTLRSEIGAIGAALGAG
ncbi:MAG TPA: protein kinase [Streptosporangiaceae bacterium]|nr:protein kinase [Streptosporangiaceae bacterium]